jgi:hypothetical protein
MVINKKILVSNTKSTRQTNKTNKQTDRQTGTVIALSELLGGTIWCFCLRTWWSKGNADGLVEALPFIQSV